MECYEDAHHQIILEYAFLWCIFIDHFFIRIIFDH